ncbi:hypothetical protein D9M71_397060 [compost metagenome]
MDSSDVADFATITLDARGLPRVQRRVLARHESKCVQRAGKAQHRFHIGLDVEEIDDIATLRPAFRQTAAADHTGQHRLLLQAFQLADEAQAAFEQANAILLAVQVVLQRLDQARPQGRTHGGHVIGNRVGQQQRLDARTEQLELLRIDEAVGDRFLVASGHQQTTQFRQVAARFSLGLWRQTSLRVANRQAVVAVQARQFFDQVDFQADIEAMAWHGNAPLPCPIGGDRQAQTAEQTLDLGRLHFHAQHLGDALGTQGDRRDRRQVLLADGFDDRAGVTASDFQQQASGALHGFTGQLPIHTTLVAVRSVGVQAIGTSLARDSDLVEEGAFQEHIASGCGHAAVLATHHAGDGQGAGVVGDHQRIVTQGDFLAVE